MQDERDRRDRKRYARGHHHGKIDRAICSTKSINRLGPRLKSEMTFAERTSTQALPAIRLPQDRIGLWISDRSILCSVALEGIECFVRVTDKRQAHLRFLLVRHRASLSTVDGTGVFLRDLIDGEVRHINVRAESRFKRSTNATKLIPDHSAEEWVVLNLCGASVLTSVATNPVFGITKEAKVDSLAC